MQIQNKVINLFNLSLIFILFTLFVPIVLPLTYTNNTNYPSQVTSSIKTAFFTSLIPISIFLYTNNEVIIINWHWVTIHTLELYTSFKFDFFSILFIPIALYITWSITEFSIWYIHKDPNINRFMIYLLLFLITMLILVTANNIFQLFIGWEGVGIMSFLLIGWWFSRTDANTAALQAIIYNRIGDIGFVLSIAWFLVHTNSWDFQQLFSININSTLPLLGLLLAAIGKSAQFGLHPWLPSAMEGPTPVSALLHSSTIVVAGIFLLIRFFPLISSSKLILSLILCIGALTTLFTAICALTQNDIKKIIAFSTSSQLGLIIVTLGINQPYISFLHICTHAFFKAILFICSGSIIHSLNDEQDIRKIGGIAKTLPITTTALITGSLALIGIPFLAGFYSKDIIIESINTSCTNAWALIITLIATSLTAAYSIRLIYYVLINNPRFPPLSPLNENHPNLLNPIKRLLIGSIFIGYIIINLIPLEFTQILTISPLIKSTALIVTAIGLLVAIELNSLSKDFKISYSNYKTSFSVLLGYFPIIFHRYIPTLSLSFSQKFATSLLDYFWAETTIPKLISSVNSYIASLTSTHTGLLKTYFLSFILIIFLYLILTTLLI